MYAQFFAIWTSDESSPHETYKSFHKIHRMFINELRKSSDHIVLCLNGRDIENAEARGKAAALLSVEGGGVICGSLEILRELYDLGVRMMTLTWKGRNAIGDGAQVNKAGGLTTFGKMVVADMERLGMIVDVSHISETGFWNVAETATKPFVASHSNSRALCDHIRNLTDEQFEAIAKTGGLVGINFAAGFVKNGKADIDALVDHIDHMMSLGGEKVLSMGSDFDGASMTEGLEGLEKVSVLSEKLLQRNYRQESIERILYGNAFDFMKRWL
jgi:membrane dipeptidase